LSISKIKNSSISSNEDITQDIKGSIRWRNVQTSESRETFGDSIGGDLEDVILWSQNEGISVDGDGDIRKFVDDVTAGEDSFSIFDDSSEFGVQSVNFLGWTDDEGGSGVANGLASARRAPSKTVASKREIVNAELPVGFRGDGGILERAGEFGRVDGAKSQFSSVASSGLGQPESENGLGDETLAHQVVPNRSDVVDRDGFISHSEDSVEFGNDEGDSRFRSRFGENLVLDEESSKIDGVLAQETGQRTSSVLNRE